MPVQQLRQRDNDLLACAERITMALELTTDSSMPLADRIYDLLERGIIEVGEHLNRKVLLAEREALLR